MPARIIEKGLWAIFLALGVPALALAEPTTDRPIPYNVLCGHLILTAGSHSARYGMSSHNARARLKERAGDFTAKHGARVPPGEGPAPPVSASSWDAPEGVLPAIVARLREQAEAFRDGPRPDVVTYAVEVEGDQVAGYVRDELEGDVNAVTTYQENDRAFDWNLNWYMGAGFYLFGQALLSGMGGWQDRPELHGYGALMGLAIGIGYVAWSNFGASGREWSRALAERDDAWSRRVVEMRELVARPVEGGWVFHAIDFERIILNEELEQGFRNYSCFHGVRRSLSNLKDIRINLIFFLEPTRPRRALRPRLNLLIHATPE